MASTCINDTRVPVRATYANLYKWPESDAAFVRSVSSNGPRHLDHPAVVDSISCRQLYLRSYTFSRKESVHEKTKKCLGRVRDSVVVRRRTVKVAASGRGGSGRQMCRRAKTISCAALMKIFRRLLACTTKVDVVG